MFLRTIVKKATGQDVHICHACHDCDSGTSTDMDIPLSSLIHLVMLNDDEALHCRTLWSDPVLEASRAACKRGLDLYAMMIALRQESLRRKRI